MDKLNQREITPESHAAQCMDSIRIDVQMLYAGTEMFGARVNDVTVATWATALSCGGVTAQELNVAVEHWITKIGGKTPTPAEVIAWIKLNRENRDVIASLRSAIAAEDAARDLKTEEKMLRIFGTRHPTRAQLRQLAERSLGSIVPKKMPKYGRSEIEQEGLASIERELENRRRAS